MEINHIHALKGIIDHDKIGKGYAKKYLQTYFSAIDRDESEIIKFVVKHYKKIKKGSSFLDIGCGPGVQHILPVAPYVESIEMADFLKNNLAEIKKWKNKKSSSHQWDTFTKYCLNLEGSKMSALNVIEREDLVRSKIKKLWKVNILDKKSLKFKKKFDAIGFFYCAEAATTRKSEWAKSIKNVTSFLCPGGWLFMSSCRNSKFYVLHNPDGTIDKIDVANVNENDFKKVLSEAGFDMKKTIINVKKVGMGHEGISEIVLIAAQKLK